MTSLKDGEVYRVRLSTSGTAVVGEAVTHFRTINRYRDLAISPDTKTIYVITDNEGPTAGPSGGYTYSLENPGAILEFKYTGSP